MYTNDVRLEKLTYLNYSYDKSFLKSYANWTTCTTADVPLTVRRVAECCGENDASCRTAPRSAAPHPV